MTVDTHAPAAHYDRVTAAWGLLLGEELHYGLFRSGDEDLATATAQLTARMIEAAGFEPGQRVLDVGCGTGAPAARLAREFGVEVLGITTSAVGVAAATERARNEGLATATFEVRDGTDNGLPPDSFDRVWVMESSHLMPDRPGLLRECARVLRPGGRLVLCDIIRRRPIPFQELRERRREFAVLRSAFGAARMDALEEYRAYAEAAGLGDVRCDDITQETLATFDRWQDNVDRHRDEVEAILGRPSVDDFEESLTILRSLWLEGTLGYGVLSASSPGE
ncbi:MAG TPA: class I SAM-dependent methyltransferase [Jatrophihabitans sp.]|jgi:cyclopropane fatty-acyl-phospholipid synthase-like methyltransferase|uniref:SAM-dependent methyltransferase n=1 Tax=Jatrophihabitans sp. TaxID=1932789 RepID=UPI002E0C9E55|nr:class I SAM-dependent methyltransferase [Jatrophihabitans sp.]